MNFFLLTGLFLNTARANPDTYIGGQEPEIMGKSKPKNEFRVGACVGEPCLAGLQLEYGTPKFTVGASSILFSNTVFAQYNALSSKNDRLRAVAGIRGYYFAGMFDLADTMGVSAYVGPELHLKYITLRATGGFAFHNYGIFSPSLSAELLYNFRLK